MNQDKHFLPYLFCIGLFVGYVNILMLHEFWFLIILNIWIILAESNQKYMYMYNQNEVDQIIQVNMMVLSMFKLATEIKI